MKYFTFDELLRSQIAAQRDIINEPFAYNEVDAYNNLEALVDNLLDPIRERFATPIIVTSGYRCKELNEIVGGVDNSQHRKGQAVDFYFQGFDRKELCEAFFEISDSFDFDQLIYYKKKGFIHISYKGKDNRHQAFVR